MADKVGICNGALIKLGAARIVSIDEDSVEAKLCKERYDQVLKDLLRSHPWNFATKWATPAVVASPPTLTFANVFQLPADCLRVFRLEYETDEWRVEGRYISSSFNPITIRYVSKEVTEDQFDDNFAEVLSLKLALDLCYSLVQNATLRDQIANEYKEALRVARSFNGQERSPERVYADSWLNSRY